MNVDYICIYYFLQILENIYCAKIEHSFISNMAFVNIINFIIIFKQIC